METDRLTIRRFTPDDWPDLLEYISQPEVAEFEPYQVFTEEASKTEAQRRSIDTSYWAVCLKNGGKLIGNIFLWKRDYNRWELAYSFNRDYQKQGYATEAALAMLDDIFANHNARRVVAFCDPLNTASWRLLERLGFRREGHLIKNTFLKEDADGNPIWRDTYEYAILRDEWTIKRDR
jgi:RimJ/RimL family protein N-acetyltransferase